MDTLADTGEKRLVQWIMAESPTSDLLVSGRGHDAAALQASLADDEVLLLNTDRSGFNIAYQMGLADARSVGDLAVSHAISDILASGGTPFAITLALLVPESMRCETLLDIMSGAHCAARRYGSVVVAGDTKANPKPAIVATALGRARRADLLTRSGAAAGDYVVTTGDMGFYLYGVVAHTQQVDIPSSLAPVVMHHIVHQEPPFPLAQALAQHHVASACTDISDGLFGSAHNIAEMSDVRIELEFEKLPVPAELENAAAHLSLDRLSLVATGGDWQFLYTIPPEKFSTASEVAKKLNRPLRVLGRVVEGSGVHLRRADGTNDVMPRVEHDSFLPHRRGRAFYAALADGLCRESAGG